MADSTGLYSGIKKFIAPGVKLDIVPVGKGKVNVNLTDPEGGPVSFFNRISVIDAKTKKRLLPVFYSDNYISILPGEMKTVEIDYSSIQSTDPKMITVEGWHAAEIEVPLMN